MFQQRRRLADQSIDINRHCSGSGRLGQSAQFLHGFACSARLLGNLLQAMAEFTAPRLTGEPIQSHRRVVGDCAQGLAQLMGQRGSDLTQAREPCNLGELFRADGDLRGAHRVR